nr:gliding motility protein GldL [uncultured Porphyromonas sp.]
MKTDKKAGKLSLFLASRRGKKVLNVAYSWGAAVVIVGALFKLLHWSFGDQMLFVGMMTEFLVFFISGFEQPEETYKWEQVFPELKTDLESTSPQDMMQQRDYLTQRAEAARQRAESFEPSSPSHLGAAAPEVSLAGVLSQEELDQLRGSIQRLSGAIDQLSRLGDLTSGMTQQWQSINLQTLNEHTAQYNEQIAALGKNITGLNAAYEAQLRDVNQQIAAIEGINAGLDRMREMYEGSLGDSNAFRMENAHMARQLQDLNRIYARLLDAMTINMGASMMSRNAYPDPYRPGYTSSYDAYPPSRDEQYPNPHQTQQ